MLVVFHFDLRLLVRWPDTQQMLLLPLCHWLPVQLLRQLWPPLLRLQRLLLLLVLMWLLWLRMSLLRLLLWWLLRLLRLLLQLLLRL